MSLEKAKTTGIAIKAILDERGVTNDSLEQFLREADERPDSRLADQWNELKDSYNSARSTTDIENYGQALIDLYETNPEDLASRRPEIVKVQQDLDTNARLRQLYTTLASEMEDI